MIRTSQEKMAELVGISRGQLQKYERGQDILNAEKLQLTANALSIPVQEFFMEGGDDLLYSRGRETIARLLPCNPRQARPGRILKITTNASRQGN